MKIIRDVAKFSLDGVRNSGYQKTKYTLILLKLYSEICNLSIKLFNINLL